MFGMKLDGERNDGACIDLRISDICFLSPWNLEYGKGWGYNFVRRAKLLVKTGLHKKQSPGSIGSCITRCQRGR